MYRKFDVTGNLLFTYCQIEEIGGTWPKNENDVFGSGQDFCVSFVWPENMPTGTRRRSDRRSGTVGPCPSFPSAPKVTNCQDFSLLVSSFDLRCVFH